MTTAADLMTEAQLQRAVFDALDALGWIAWHDHDSRRNRRGLPDVVAVNPRQGRVIFAELKTMRGRLRREQAAWIDALGSVPAVEVFVWRPSDLLDGTIARTLARKAQP